MPRREVVLPGESGEQVQSDNFGEGAPPGSSCSGNIPREMRNSEITLLSRISGKSRHCHQKDVKYGALRR